MSMWEHRDRAKQLINFDGLVDGKKYPTDIDGLIEWKDRGFIFIECKRGGKALPFGQQLALERLASGLTSAGKPSIVVVAEHDTNPSEDIELADCQVRKLYWKGGWFKGDIGTTVRDIVARYEDYLEA